MKNPDAAKAYYADMVILEIMPKVPVNDFMEIGFNFLENTTSQMRSSRAQDIVARLFELDNDRTKAALLASKSTAMHKILLASDDLTVEEEEKALRAVSTSKFTPTIIYKKQYKPSCEALKKLPPVMRLKTLESLTNSRKVKYNIFQNINEDDFKALLFTASMKHTDRAQSVSHKYHELKYMGQEASLEIKGHCEFCGEYSVRVTSGVVRTATGLKSASIAKVLTRQNCLFCYHRLSHAPSIEEVI